MATGAYFQTTDTGVTVVLKDDDGLALHAYGTVAASTLDTASEYQKGCIYVKTDVADGSKAVYENTGTALVPAWNLLGEVATGDLADASVTKSKVSYEVATVSIEAATSGTATVVAGGEILGFYVTAITGTERVKTIGLSGTTLIVTLTGSDTATVKVVLLKA